MQQEGTARLDWLVRYDQALAEDPGRPESKCAPTLRARALAARPARVGSPRCQCLSIPAVSVFRSLLSVSFDPCCQCLSILAVSVFRSLLSVSFDPCCQCRGPRRARLGVLRFSWARVPAPRPPRLTVRPLRYLASLYFTVVTLSTVGFGDVSPPPPPRPCRSVHPSQALSPHSRPVPFEGPGFDSQMHLSGNRYSVEGKEAL